MSAIKPAENPADDPYGEKYIKQWEDFVAKTPAPDAVDPGLVTREQWGALPPKETPKPLNMPIQIALYTHTETEECNTREECIKFLQEKQKEDMGEKELNDIQFNFYIGGDKTIYEGRGWQVDADKEYINKDIEGKSVDIAYIGDYEGKVLAPELVQLGVDLIKYGRKMEYMHINYNITTYWEDHIEGLRLRTNYNPLEDEELRSEIPDV